MTSLNFPGKLLLFCGAKSVTPTSSIKMRNCHEELQRVCVYIHPYTQIYERGACWLPPPTLNRVNAYHCGPGGSAARSSILSVPGTPCIQSMGPSVCHVSYTRYKLCIEKVTRVAPPGGHFCHCAKFELVLIALHVCQIGSLPWRPPCQRSSIWLEG